jgi:lipopolysaccharide biosynthesis glycosyltransferase
MINVSQYATDLVGIKLYAHFSVETMFHFFIPEFIQYGKVVYLDCDMIILGDINDHERITNTNSYTEALDYVREKNNLQTKK